MIIKSLCCSYFLLLLWSIKNINLSFQTWNIQEERQRIEKWEEYFKEILVDAIITTVLSLVILWSATYFPREDIKRRFLFVFMEKNTFDLNPPTTE